MHTENCGNSDDFSVEYAASNSAVEQFSVGYTGVNWRVFVSPSISGSVRAEITLRLKFPNQPGNDATFSNVVRLIGTSEV